MGVSVHFIVLVSFTRKYRWIQAQKEFTRGPLVAATSLPDRKTPELTFRSFPVGEIIYTYTDPREPDTFHTS